MPLSNILRQVLILLWFQRVRCGEYFSVAATSENDVLFWGTKITSSASPEDVNPGRSTTTTNLCGSVDMCVDHSLHAGGADLTGGAGGAGGGGAARTASESEGTKAGVLKHVVLVLGALCPAQLSTVIFYSILTCAFKT